MAGPRSIVVGTDGSERAQRAVDRAGELAKALGATVHVVTGYSRSVGAPLMAAPGFTVGADVHEHDANRTYAQHCVDRAQRRLAQLGVASDAHVWPGDPGAALMRIADEQDAQMIVVGNRGMTGVRRVLGSVPNHVSHHARCDVLIVTTDEAP